MRTLQQRGAGRDFLPRPLPLRGPDWTFEVDRQGTLRDYRIVKEGDTITIDFPFITNDKTVIVGEDAIEIRGFNRREDIRVEQDGQKVRITRDMGNQWTVIEKDGDTITFRHRDPTKQLKFIRDGQSLVIDRFGGDVNDVTLEMRDGVLRVDKRGTSADVAFTLDGMALDPVTFRQDTTLDPQAWDLLWKWFDEGIRMEDLVWLTQDGKVEVIEGIFE